MMYCSEVCTQNEDLSRDENMENAINIDDKFDACDLKLASVDTSTNNGFGPIPEKRKKRAALLSAVLSFVIMIVLLGAFTQPQSKLTVIQVSNTSDDEMICKENERQGYHVGVFVWSLNLIGIILGEFINRFCLVFEEYFHLNTRYGGSKRKMFYACFSDVSFRCAFFGTFVASVIIAATLFSQGGDYFKFEYIEIILSGIGSGSFVLYILSLDSFSRVQISSLMENNNRLVANGLAWSYYFGYLKIILPGITERIENSKWKDKLSSKKLFILMPRDCYAYGLLSNEDSRIKMVPDDDAVIEHKVYRAGVFRIYRLNIYKINRTGENSSPLYVLAQYASPMSRLHEMSHEAGTRLTRQDQDEQAKLFLRTMKAILQNPSVPEVRDNCRLVPYARNTPGLRLSDLLAEAVLQDMQRSG